MPCYEVNIITVAFKAKNRDLLIKALTTVNSSYFDSSRRRISIEQAADLIIKTGEVNTFRSNILNKLSQEYTREAVRFATKKKKWAMKVNTKNQNKIQLIRY